MIPNAQDTCPFTPFAPNIHVANELRLVLASKNLLSQAASNAALRILAVVEDVQERRVSFRRLAEGICGLVYAVTDIWDKAIDLWFEMQKCCESLESIIKTLDEIYDFAKECSKECPKISGSPYEKFLHYQNRMEQDLVAFLLRLPQEITAYRYLSPFFCRPLLLVHPDTSYNYDKTCPRRLIHTQSLQLVNFKNNEMIPHYAILSHRWGEEEIGIQEFSHPTEETKQKAGYQKIIGACRQACLDNLGYLWVDTCCINQEDKGDVHRNIKSMFAYYRNSRICYAYLVDVKYSLYRHWQCYDFEKSQWFSRGWTLQELLAPQEVFFFNKYWYYIGSRTERFMDIHHATGIPQNVIRGLTPIHEVNVQERMTWAVLRTTTRLADQAYCLLGILDVTLEPDYSETVEVAFERLQKAFEERYPNQSKEFHGQNEHLGLYVVLLLQREWLTRKGVPRPPRRRGALPICR